MKKKLVIATDNFLPRWDGIARFLSEMIPRLAASYEITVIAPDFGTYSDPNIRIVRVPLMRVMKVGDYNLPKFRKGMIDAVVRDCDLVFTQTIGPIGTLAINSAKRHRKPISAFIHSIEWELVPKAMGNVLLKKYSQILAKRHAKSMYNKCDLLIMPSSHVSELFLWNNIRTKSTVVHLGVDTEKFSPMPAAQRAALREQLDFGPGEIIIGYHGRIGREKDLMTLLRAFTRLQVHYSKLRLLIVGNGVESIKEQIASRPGTILVGQKNNPTPYLQAMDIYVLPSLTETTSLSVLEAMSCSLAVISTEVGFIKNYIRPGYNGMFFEKQNPFHLAKNIERLIRNEKLRSELGENARKTVIEKFSWERTSDGIEEALSSLTQKDE